MSRPIDKWQTWWYHVRRTVLWTPSRRSPVHIYTQTKCQQRAHSAGMPNPGLIAWEWRKPELHTVEGYMSRSVDIYYVRIFRCCRIRQTCSQCLNRLKCKLSPGTLAVFPILPSPLLFPSLLSFPPHSFPLTPLSSLTVSFRLPIPVLSNSYILCSPVILNGNPGLHPWTLFRKFFCAF